MERNYTKEQIELLREHSKYNYVIITDERKALEWDGGFSNLGKPIIYGDIAEAETDFKKGTDIAILSVAEYCKAFNVKAEDIMDI